MRRLLTVSLVAFCLLSTACGGTKTEATSSKQSPTSAASSPAATPSPTNPSPTNSKGPLDFSGTTLTGASFDGASLSNKLAVLWFWAPWCPKCAREAKHVAAAQAAYGDRVAIIGIPAFGTVPEMKEFTTNFKVAGITHVADPEGNIWFHFRVTEQPAYAFIDTSGTVEIVRGEIGPDRFNARLAQLLAK